MTDRERQRRLHVQNRLEELRARHGRELEDDALPDWLDHMPTTKDEAQPAMDTPQPQAVSVDDASIWTWRGI